jgi:type IV conjugative transfer system coupling protein TraD
MVREYTRGGQTFLHNIRMFVQITRKLLLLIIFFFCVTVWGIFYLKTDHYDFYVWHRYYLAKFLVGTDRKATLEFRLPNGKKYLTRGRDIIHADAVLDIMKVLDPVFVKSLYWGLLITLLSSASGIIFLINRGKQQVANKNVSGNALVEPKTLRRLIHRQGNASTLTLAEIPLIKGKEKVHFLCNGTTGTGKSVAVRELLDQIKQRGDKAFILDRNGDFIRTHYDKEHRQDIILNTLDERGSPWNLWAECRDSTDYDSIAAALIPMPNSAQDPFWINGARAIFASAARQMAVDPNRSMRKLLQYLLTVDLDTISTLLKNTEAESLVSEKIAKTALSIRSVLAVYLRSLKYVVEGDNFFSIRRWMNDDSQRNWVFVSSLADKDETLRPLLSTWLDVAANAMISLSPDDDRRIWLILDELHSMQKMPYLQTALAEGRKYGGCIVITTHSIAQLRMIYGQNESEAISNLCNTRVHFRSVDTDSAQWSSNDLGKQEVEETNEGISYGASAIRDGISISRHRRIKPLVSIDEIMRLPDLTAYLRLPGEIPVAQVQFKVPKRPSVAAHFAPRALNEKMDADLEALFEKNNTALTEVALKANEKTLAEKREAQEENSYPNPMILDDLD